MNIALFASSYYPHLGGVEELCRQLAREYRRREHGVIVVTNRWPRNLLQVEEVEGIPVYRVAMRVPEGGFRVRMNYELTHRRIRREVVETLRRHEVDVMHIQCVSSNGLYALEARERLGIPLITTLQGELTMDASQLYQRSAYARGLLRQVLEKSDAITGCSLKTLRDGEEFFGQPFGARGKVIFNGASIGDFQQGTPFVHHKPYIIAMGRIVPQKGFDILLRAYAAAAIDLDLVIAGDGPELASLKDLAQELKIADRMIFPGRADRKMVVSLFLGASFFVLPSRADEGLPVVCAEALAAGKAVIATRSGGAPEAVIHEKHGLIVEKEDVVGLAEAMRRLAAELSLCAKFAAAAKDRSADFSWQTIATQYLDAYQAARASAAQCV